jgi:valyl-tRNA synthetase
VVRFESVKEIISAVRTIRKSKDLPNREKLELLILSDNDNSITEFLPVISKLCNLSDITFVSEKQEGAASFMVGTTEYFIPMAGKLDIEAELIKIEEELVYHRGFLAAVMKKLENERFVQNAPADVLELERKKKNDAGSKIKSLEERQEELRKL